MKRPAKRKNKIAGYEKTTRKGKKTTVHYTRLGAFFDTTTIKELDQLQKQYHKLALKYHPDAGGTTEQMQQLNAEYDTLRDKILSGSSLTADQKENEIKLDDNLRAAIAAVVGYPGITIELVGKWLWIGGNTYPIRFELSKAGFHYASKKIMWYYKGTESGGRGKMAMDEIRAKYGSKKMTSENAMKKLKGVENKIPIANRRKLYNALKRATKNLNKRPV